MRRDVCKLSSEISLQYSCGLVKWHHVGLISQSNWFDSSSRNHLLMRKRDSGALRKQLPDRAEGVACKSRNAEALKFGLSFTGLDEGAGLEILLYS